METKEIYETELNNQDSIYLYKEGMFWRAYQHSAYFTVRDLKSCTPLRKTVKKIKAELVYIGFPDTVLTDFLTRAADQGLTVKLAEEKRIILSGCRDLDNYALWVESLRAEQVQSEPTPVSGHSAVVQMCGQCPIKEILSWSIASMTPMELMNKVYVLQQKLILTHGSVL